MTKAYWESKIFAIKEDDFLSFALEAFAFQKNNNPVYNRYLKETKQFEKNISEYYQFPTLPISFFKTHDVVTPKPNTESSSTHVFLSSGTTDSFNRSKHIVLDLSIYEKNIYNIFNKFYGPVNQYFFIGLLPNYLENKSSSLIHMVDKLIKQGRGGAFINELDEVIIKVNQLTEAHCKVVLFGVAYSLLDLAEYMQKNNVKFNNTENIIIVETGGMKGRRKEITKEELHLILQKQLNIDKLHSEYGMTELLSQAYSSECNKYLCPPQMKVFITELNDPFAIIKEPNKKGVINIIDLANIYSCSFIKTEDIGQINSDGTFSVNGRLDYSDLRGCNLLMDS
ncbi:MAG: hypothetical protein A2X12_10775 [Bacteroidetes bacterium GWE2_29_8]|nr:MAG: hypothetical protein A2X12_10775 [Bacteroidetes bacterium GWE2_29_8]OFY17420.1 MAG: hypothetical protein A2X02_00800 [Bacteroidetes bacterium GWF2_29_10]